MKLDWLRVCAEGQTTDCIPGIQLAYLAVLVVGVVILAVALSRSRDLSTGTLALMPVAIAINIALGATVTVPLPVIAPFHQSRAPVIVMFPLPPSVAPSESPP